MYPKHIEGTWHYSGDWFGCLRLVASNQQLDTYHWEHDDELCPICEYPDAISLDPERDEFPSLKYCPECLSVWSWYVARCPDCDGMMWKKACKDGELACSKCGMVWDTESIKEINTDVEFHNEGEVEND